jgi:hypothetical protein
MNSVLGASNKLPTDASEAGRLFRKIDFRQ